MRKPEIGMSIKALKIVANNLGSDDFVARLCIIEGAERLEERTAFSDMHYYAFRYALGRMSIAPSVVVAWLSDNWLDIDESNKEQIIREINEAIKTDTAGMAMDIKEWQKVLDL